LRTRRTIAICLLFVLQVLAADSLRTTDSLHPIGDQSSGWLDSTLVLTDSLGTATDFAHRWLWPLALAAVTLGGLFLLFSVRSK
jgi:hypothetical protein